MILIKHQLKVEMTMNGSLDSDKRWFGQSELDLVGSVVPEMVDSVALLVVEVFLLSVGSFKESRTIERLWKLLNGTSELW